MSLFWEDGESDAQVNAQHFVATQSDWRAPPPDQWKDWKGHEYISFDCETCDPDLLSMGPGVRRGSYMVGFSVGYPTGHSIYIPLRHEGGDNVEDPDQALSWLRTQAQTFEGELVGANLGYDLDFCAGENIYFPLAQINDVQVTAALLNENRRKYNLDSLSLEYLGEGKDESLLRQAALAYGVDPKGGLWRLPARFVGPYGEGDTDRPMRLRKLFKPMLEEQNLVELNRMENDLVPLFLAMTQQGIPVDEERLIAANGFFLEQHDLAVAKVKDITGFDIAGNLMATGLISQVLSEEGITCPLTEKGNISIVAEWLENLHNPVADAIRSARKMEKMRGTFVKGIQKHLINGRVHPNFHPLRADDGGTVSGRPSCSNPNLLNQPVRDPILGPMFRSIYRPEPGEHWVKHDYSQQEPRLTVHYAYLMDIIGADKMVEAYRDDPSTDVHQMLADMGQIERKPAKSIFLGLCYGMGGGLLCRSLGFEVEEKTDRFGKTYEVAGTEGRAFLRTFDQRVPFLKRIFEYAEKRVNKRGYIVTILNRRSRFPVIQDNGGRAFSHKALNRLIQGSAADQTKKAMLDVWRETKRVPYLQVYDELDHSLADPTKDAPIIAEIMENAIKLEVPSKVDWEVGPSWGEVK